MRPGQEDRRGDGPDPERGDHQTGVGSPAMEDLMRERG